MTGFSLRGLIGRKCLVTGAASGIGDAVARALGASGARVISLDLNAPSAEVERHIPCDLADPTSIRDAVAAVGDSLDVLCNVAGLPGTKPDEVLIKVNFLGLRALTEALVPVLSPGGAVVNVASGAGMRWADRTAELREFVSTDGFDDGYAWFCKNLSRLEQPAYNLSKEAVIFYTMFRALDLWGQGVRINAVCPGPVETPILKDFEESMGKEALESIKGAVGRHARPDDIAPLVVVLAAPELAWISGQCVGADAGIGGALLSGAIPMPV
jgi:NAD(P)-dependent dehydrogenase (short-subunit alcohol dehydrogenase family)